MVGSFFVPRLPGMCFGVEPPQLWLGPGLSGCQSPVTWALSVTVT